nr:DUF1524 domain-containing protein [Kocuria palustris]
MISRLWGFPATPDDEADVTPARSRMTTPAKIGIGCGGCLGLLVLAFVALVVIALIVGPSSEEAEDPRPGSSASSAPQASEAPSSEAQEPGGAESSEAAEAPEAVETSAQASEPESSPAPVDDSAASDSAEALTVLETLDIKGRAPKTGYGRDLFGPTWHDVDGNGCSTRNDILARDLTGIEREDGCSVSSGLLQDPYTDTAIDFTAGMDTSAEVQIDHVVALSDAWQKGAQQLSEQQRLVFANDPLNLLAVDGPTNQSKGDGDAATWLPPNRSYWCPYVARQVDVKAKYDLWVTQPEHDRMAEVLRDCEGESSSDSGSGSDQSSTRVPAESAPQPAPAPEPAPESEPVPAPAQEPAPAPAAPGAAFANCSEARAAGAAPLHRGMPGYAPRMDGDGDGVACE